MIEWRVIAAVGIVWLVIAATVVAAIAIVRAACARDADPIPRATARARNRSSPRHAIRRAS